MAVSGRNLHIQDSCERLGEAQRLYKSLHSSGLQSLREVPLLEQTVNGANPGKER